MADPAKLRDMAELGPSSVDGQENLYYEKDNGTFGRVRVYSIGRTTWPFAFNHSFYMGESRYYRYLPASTSNPTAKTEEEVVDVPRFENDLGAFVNAGSNYYIIPSGKKLYLDKISYNLGIGNGGGGSYGYVAIANQRTGTGTSNIVFNSQGTYGMTYFTNQVLYDNSAGSGNYGFYLSPGMIYKGTIFLYTFSCSGEVTIR